MKTKNLEKITKIKLKKVKKTHAYFPQILILPAERRSLRGQNGQRPQKTQQTQETQENSKPSKTSKDLKHFDTLPLFCFCRSYQNECLSDFEKILNVVPSGSFVVRFLGRGIRESSESFEELKISILEIQSTCGF